MSTNYQTKAVSAVPVPEFVLPDVVGIAMGDIAEPVREGSRALAVGAGL